MRSIDVTDLVDFYNYEDGCLPIRRCVCGAMFHLREFIITRSISKNRPCICPTCGCRMYFSLDVRVFMVKPTKAASQSPDKAGIETQKTMERPDESETG